MAGQSQTLYRKWRSQTFGDLVGQDAVIHTLRQAVAQQRLAHAYLFCGPRGTGKTSTARLLAKMVNCLNPRDGEPCNACLPCIEITEGRSTDVFEIDAASNRGIDEIRDLRERVRVASATGRTRVYTIDEVHMLTTEAFNALLKTLEEPPPHVIFVLATTEAHKVPATVVSRCQHFDFRRIALGAIVGHLSFVSEQEGMRVEPGALELIARAAQGGMRDALSLLDQARAFAGDTISAEAVRGMLGMADPTMVRDLITFVATGDTAAGLHRVNALAQSGVDLRQLANQVAELWRQLMLARAGADLVALLDVTDDVAADLKAASDRFPLDVLTECARIFARNDAGARIQVVPQLSLELAFLDCVAVMQGRHAPHAAATVTAMPQPSPIPIRPPSPVAVPDMPHPNAPTPLRVSEPPSNITPITHGHQPAAPEAAAPPEPAATVREPAPERSYQVASAPLFDQLAEQWEVIRRVCKQKSPPVEALLKEAYPVAVEPGTPATVIVAVKQNFHLKKLSQPDNMQKIEWAIEQVVEARVQVRFIPESEAGNYVTVPRATPTTPSVPSPSPTNVSATVVAPEPPPAKPQPPADDPRTLAQSDALVQALQREFGAKIVDVRPS